MTIRIVGGLGLLFVLLQLVRPKLTAPPVRAELDAPADVKQILKKACYACHSNETRLSWFDHIVPAYQVAVHDVKRGRSSLNFSDLGAQSRAHQNAILFEAVSQIELGAMPPPLYTRFHPDEVVTANEINLLKRYLSTVPLRPAMDATRLAADRQYTEWISRGNQPLSIKAAPNGIVFIPEYKNWKLVSVTDRNETNTLKLILGNDVAIRAIAAGQINPWPDGSALAKVSWRKQLEGGAVRTGPFEQVAFMIKNRKKYTTTAGWGWAQWMGTELKPFGKDASFPQDCVACHAPLRQNDYVFTSPIAAVRRNR